MEPWVNLGGFHPTGCDCAPDGSALSFSLSVGITITRNDVCLSVAACSRHSSSSCCCCLTAVVASAAAVAAHLLCQPHTHSPK